MKKIYYYTFAALLGLPSLIFAQSTISGGGGNPSNGTSNGISFKITNPFSGGDDLTSVVATFLQKIVMPLAAVYVVLMIIYAGFQYIQAQGNPGAIKKANESLLYALIGAVVLLGATAIAAAVKGTICGPLINCS